MHTKDEITPDKYNLLLLVRLMSVRSSAGHVKVTV